MAKTSEKKRFLLRIDLLFAHRPIWREVIVPSDLGLDRLHNVIQDAMGWEESHLHAFEHKGIRYEDPIMLGEEVEHPDFAVSLDDLLKRSGSKLTYSYDFGDGWEHLVTLRKTLPWDEEKIFVCTGAEGACPLEDCGGVYGHERICRYLENPEKNNDGFMDYAEWVPDDYDPDFVDLEQINEDLDVIRLEEDDELNAQLADEILAEIGETANDGAPDGMLPGFEGGFEDEEEEPHHPYEDLSDEDRAQFEELFRLGEEIRNVEPWNDLWDQDIFGIRDPDTGLLDFVSVLGRGGEVFAVHVHRPPEGYDFWKNTQTGQLEASEMDGYLRQLRVTELEFTGKAEMEGADLDLYEALPFPKPKRGKQQWMRVRRYHPRSFPWFPKPDDLPPLVRGAALTIRLIEKLRSNPKGSVAEFIRNRAEDGTLSTTLPIFSLPESGDEKDASSWTLEVSPVDWSEARGLVTSYQPTEFELERIASLPETKETWEIGASHMTVPVMTQSGPVLPMLAFAVPTSFEGNAPMPYSSFEIDETAGECVWNAFFQTATDRGHRPARIRVRTEIAAKTFQTTAERTGTQIERADSLSYLDDLFQTISRGL